MQKPAVGRTTGRRANERIGGQRHESMIMTHHDIRNRPSKYGNRRTTVDGIMFASQREATRYAELILLARAGQIRELELQPRFPFHVGNQRVFTYIADFSYFDRQRDGARIVEDVKGVRTREYLLKKRCIEAQYGVKIEEV
jgi:hypothetical protein